MSASFPGSIKSFTTLVDLADSVLAEHQNAQQDEITAIETELGVDPGGNYSDVVSRLDGADTGWKSVSQAWTYASADDPVYQVYVDGDVTANADYKAGNKIKCTNNSTTVYGFIVNIGSYDSGNDRTPVDIYCGTDYDIANSAITAIYISKVKSPDGFPMSKAKWTVLVSNTSDQSQESPTSSVWYNLGSLSIDIPIGVWDVSFQVPCAAQSNASQTAVNVSATLSTANNSESDKDMTGGSNGGGASGTLWCMGTFMREKVLSLSSKTTYYLNAKTTTSCAGIYFYGSSIGTIVIEAVCAYL